MGIEALNGIENARLTEVADPVPAAGEVCCVSAMRTSGEPRALPITVRLIVKPLGRQMKIQTGRPQTFIDVEPRWASTPSFC